MWRRLSFAWIVAAACAPSVDHVDGLMQPHFAPPPPPLLAQPPIAPPATATGIAPSASPPPEPEAPPRIVEPPPPAQAAMDARIALAERLAGASLSGFAIVGSTARRFASLAKARASTDPPALAWVRPSPLRILARHADILEVETSPAAEALCASESVEELQGYRLRVFVRVRDLLPVVRTAGTVAYEDGSVVSWGSGARAVLAADGSSHVGLGADETVSGEERRRRLGEVPAALHFAIAHDALGLSFTPAAPRLEPLADAVEMGACERAPLIDVLARHPRTWTGDGPDAIWSQRCDPTAAAGFQLGPVRFLGRALPMTFRYWNNVTKQPHGPRLARRADGASFVDVAVPCGALRVRVLDALPTEDRGSALSAITAVRTVRSGALVYFNDGRLAGTTIAPTHIAEHRTTEIGGRTCFDPTVVDEFLCHDAGDLR